MSCKLYAAQCSEDCGASGRTCSLGSCITQEFDFKSLYFISAVIYSVFAVVTIVQSIRMLKETEFGCLKTCFQCRKLQDKKTSTNRQKKRPPVLLFLALSLLTRCVWFLLLDYWTELKNFDCRKTYEIETQFPTLIGLNISVCLFQFTTLSLIAMYLARVTYDAELRITLSASSSQHDSSYHLGLQIYDYIYENDESVWLWAHCRCIHRAEFWVISNLWTYLIGLFFWIYEWTLICVEDDEKKNEEDTLKFLYTLQVAAIAFLFALLTLSFLDSMRRLGFLIKSLQMEGFPTVKRFTLLNRILFSTALLYLTAFNGTQAWRFIGFEERVGDLDENVDTAQSTGWNTCSILYPHVFYTFPEIILTVALLWVIRPVGRFCSNESEVTDDADEEEIALVERPGSTSRSRRNWRSRGKNIDSSLGHMAHRRELLNRFMNNRTSRGGGSEEGLAV